MTPQELFSVPIDSYVKAFLKILPSTMLPEASFNVIDPEFFNYISCKIP